MIMPKEFISMLNNALKIFNNTFKVLDIGTEMTANATREISESVAFIGDVMEKIR
jgi:nitrous oxidase accessory protein NosD